MWKQTLRPLLIRKSSNRNSRQIIIAELTDGSGVKVQASKEVPVRQGQGQCRAQTQSKNEVKDGLTATTLDALKDCCQCVAKENAELFPLRNFQIRTI